MIPNPPKKPEQISDRELNYNSLSQEQRQRIEDSPLLQFTTSELQSQTAHPIQDSKQDHGAVRFYSFFNRWWLELLYCGLTICILVALVVTLHLFQGRKVSSWPLAITINTFVAICTLSIKASLGFVLSNGIVASGVLYSCG